MTEDEIRHLKDVNQALQSALRCAVRELSKTAWGEHQFALLRYCRAALAKAELPTKNKFD